ncbi:hypothetical protein IFU30_19290 [Plantibacter sp. CFBP 8798]|uniref:hypothetical protein n=1 Tax=Plantibacter sp. CFBP 8798 TaxID=2775268 RepID=UPI001783FE4B|nr:hypothetical protein [Plantibacter sp. CFBP 8798]MBD8468420.1 hypothetical protein [Plantibacter sp. CFBP 8798]
MRLRIPAVLASIALLAGLFTVAPVVAQPASAAVASDFQAGNIISDALFYDGGAMTAGQVQGFLNSARPSCRSGYTCLKDYGQATPSRAAVAGRCAAYAGSALESAATIIAKVGAACGISQKVLIVMLEKEQSLITDDWPSARQYRSAMGYGCPDTADCDTNYYGFFNQVYAAALQFKNYQANPTRWNHVAGRVNAVRFNPNAACGSSNVFIQNAATAGLYNYTPYQPNASALANLYGTGDACGAYGNRNFWRLYTDWYGSTTGGSSLMKTADSAAIYVVTDTQKYYITDTTTLAAYSSLGGIATVSRSTLDRYPTAGNATRIIRSASGGIYFIDAGIKVGFSSCGMVVDYGGSCNAGGYTQLTDAQTSLFVSSAAVVTPVFATTAGARYYVTLGTKREISDATAQAAAGIPAPIIVLTEDGIANLPDGAPIVRDSIYLNSRGQGVYNYVVSGKTYTIGAGTAPTLGLPGRSASALWPRNVAKLGAGGAFTGAVVSTATTTPQIVTAAGRYSWQGGPSLATVPATQSFIDSYPALGTIGDGANVKGATSAVYLLTGGKLRTYTSWNALVAMVNNANPSIITLPPPVIGQLASGAPVLTPGSLVRTESSNTVYLIDGAQNRVPVSSFDYTTALGFTGTSFVAQAHLDAYTVDPAPLGFGITCNGQDYLAAAGTIHKLDPSLKSLYPIRFTALSPITCALLTPGIDAGKFVRTPNGTIYLLEGGTKRGISSMARFAELGGVVGAWLDVPYTLSDQFPVGPNA